MVPARQTGRKDGAGRTITLHRVREGLKEERTACINRIRGVLAEYGLVFGQSPKRLRAVLADVIEDASNEMPARARLVVQRAFEHWRELDEHLHWCDQQVGQHVRASPEARRAAKVIGIGELGASAVTASVGDFKQFRSGAQFGAWLGLVPRQNSTGGKASLGRITKRGDDYLRTLLIQGAKSAVMSAGKRVTRYRAGLLNWSCVWAGKRPAWPWPTRTPASCGR